MRLGDFCVLGELRLEADRFDGRRRRGQDFFRNEGCHLVGVLTRLSGFGEVALVQELSHTLSGQDVLWVGVAADAPRSDLLEELLLNRTSACDLRPLDLLSGLDAFAFQRGEGLIVQKVSGRVLLRKSAQRRGRLLDPLNLLASTERDLIGYVHDAGGFVAEQLAG